MLRDSGFVDISVSQPCDTFAGARGESKARKFGVWGYTFMAHRPR